MRGGFLFGPDFVKQFFLSVVVLFAIISLEKRELVALLKLDSSFRMSSIVFLCCNTSPSRGYGLVCDL